MADTYRKILVVVGLLLVLGLGFGIGQLSGDDHDHAHDHAHGHDHEHGDTLERLLDAGMTLEQAEIIAEHFDELDALQDAYYAEGDHSHSGGDFWDEFFHVITDPAHWAFELTAELTFFVLFHIWFVRWMAHRHNKKHGVIEEFGE